MRDCLITSRGWVILVISDYLTLPSHKELGKSSRTPRPGFSLFECYRQKSVYWSSSWARILNVQDIIKEKTKETSSNISSTCIPSTIIAGAGQHLFNTCLRCTSYRGYRPTHSLRRCPVIETTPCFLTAALCWWRFHIPAPERQNNTIHWPNADVMLGHCLRRLANIIPTKTLQGLNHKYNRDYFFLNTC